MEALNKLIAIAEVLRETTSDLLAAVTKKPLESLSDDASSSNGNWGDSSELDMPTYSDTSSSVRRVLVIVILIFEKVQRNFSALSKTNFSKI